ncbi:MAG TPA: HDOD domain-containing protein [Rhodocyclaceae bacterium]|jgi:HD-like signal output (HDOD) protein|nr:HDOD domain-containing protein [Betaproteobacteria bacterium]HMU99563.1 HDOD domain-containing protein [Rhodocyclaceae bacterium]HMV20545.1 HDOD domain-containing protein [Rhodocyclaceae bacterium]HMW77443.1 HDOD domain-containing protein [Rhodocyclaceae bacterium]HNE41845.1 HDOD domain-containing protein [Rhodocyclaceae bacterium]
MSTPSADDDKVGDALNAQRFQMLEDIAKELAGEIVFPTYFDAALRLRKALQDTDQPLARIVAAISLEPLIAAKLMKLANSALYGGSSAAVRDLGSAIQRLGLETVRTTALAIAMGQMLRSKEMAPFSDLTRQLWDHTLKTAVAARLLAKSHTRLNPDEALLAGLVHDLGAFYMLYRAAQYAELRARPETVKYLIVQWHEGIGVSLLNALGLPEEIVAATIDHDQPRPALSTVRSLTDVVYVANILAGAHFEWLFQDVDPDAGEPGVIRRTFASLLASIDSETEAMRAALTG